MIVPILGLIIAIINIEIPIAIKSVFMMGFMIEMFGLNLSKLDFE